jgi:formate dehydrogenase subunit gamma
MVNTIWIQKHSPGVRVFHYLLVLSFIPLALTGIVLFFKPFTAEAMNSWMQVHVAFGVLLTIDAAAFFLVGFDRMLLFIKRIFTVTGNDLKWFSVLGGYPQKFLLHKKIPVPPMGKYNSGQKLFGICILIGGTILIVTGWALWAFPHVLPHGMGALFGHLHTILGGFLTLFLLVHMFLGVYMFDDFKAMFLHGRIPYGEAREVAPLWVERELTRIEKA